MSLPFRVVMLLVFALTLFVSATLLFLIEPMVGKMITPLLGGSPAVWNTCMVFFQAALLAGYAYAHASTAWLGVRRQALLQMGLLVLPLLQFLVFPLTVSRNLLPSDASNPVPWVLAILVLTVGLPFFVVSSSAPLLQKWFAGTGHPAARDPYFLYGASNLGSMLALASYPLLVERWLPLATQARWWTFSYGLLAALTALCALLLWRSNVVPADKLAATVEPQATAPEDEAPPTPWQRLRWIALAFVPSSLMLGVTTYITTDIAAIPLLWVLPLAVYLLSFILVFSRWPALLHRGVLLLMPPAVLILLFLMAVELKPRTVPNIAIHLVVLFLVAMACHGELARQRPATRYLTQFYLLMSVGGVLGGLFNALVAPLIFSDVIEYPIALVLACLVLPATASERKSAGRTLPRVLDLVLPLAIGVATFLALVLISDEAWSRLDQGMAWMWASMNTSSKAGWPAKGLIHFINNLDWDDVHGLLIFGIASLCCYLCVNRTLRYGLAVGALWLASYAGVVYPAWMSTMTGRPYPSFRIIQERSFFGVLTVKRDRQRESRATFHSLVHGSTLHGRQRLHWDDELYACCASPLAAAQPLELPMYLLAGQDAWADACWQDPHREALTYYHRTGPIGQVFTAFPSPQRNIAVIGLGTGTLATYGQPGQNFTYYEIDRSVQGIAENPAYFTYLHDARERGVQLKVVLGDARLQMERARLTPEEKYHLIVVDAFTSDAIPVHLITQEANAIYFRQLAPDGLVAYHISNRYLDLEPVLQRLAETEGLAALVQYDRDMTPVGKTISKWVLVARDASAFGKLLSDDRWHSQLKTRPELRVWSDDYSNVLSVFDFDR